MSVKVLIGDCLTVLPTLAAKSAQCCITSVPYWWMRDYGVEGQLGLEASLDEWLSNQVRVFRLVREALRDDGTLWLNVGDAYSDSGRGPNVNSSLSGGQRWQDQTRKIGRRPSTPGIKPKDLIGMPWELALALRRDGWYLRNDIIWRKPNVAPESAADRCTREHEYVFLFSKSRQYHFDGDAIAEPASKNTDARAAKKPVGLIEAPPGTTPQSRARGAHWPTVANHQHGPGGHSTIARARGVNPKAAAVDGDRRGPRPRANASFSASVVEVTETRNARTVWTIPNVPSIDSEHFAAFPPELARRCIAAGCPVGGLVLDPFGGTGTVGEVALKMGRRAILIELNPKYAKQAHKRLHDRVPLFAGGAS